MTRMVEWYHYVADLDVGDRESVASTLGGGSARLVLSIFRCPERVGAIAK